MGLLGDGWDDPKSSAIMALAGGLLSSNSIGQGFARGVQGYQQALTDAEDRKLKRAMTAAQMAGLQDQHEQRQIAIAQAKAGQQLAQSLMRDNVPADMQVGPVAEGQKQPYASSPGGFLRSLSIDQALAIGQATGKDLLPAWKIAKEGLTQNAGTYTTDPYSGAQTYLPKLPEGMGMSGGVASVVPQYAESNAAIKGAEAGAVERAKAGYDPLSLDHVDVSTGRPVGGSRLSYIENQSQPQQAPQPQGGLPSLGGNTSNLSPALMDAIRRDAQANGIQNPVANFSGGSRFDWVPNGSQPQPQQGGHIQLQSKAEAAKAVKTAEADVVRDTTNKADEKRFNQFTSSIDEAIRLLNSGPTGSGLGEMRDKALGWVGLSTDGGKAAARLTTLGAWLTANVPRMEGPQSDKDVARYQAMAGDIGDSSKPIETRLAAAMGVKSLQEKYASLNGYGGQQDKAPTAMPLPANPKASDLKVNQVYDTPRGPAVWDGFRFKKVQ